MLLVAELACCAHPAGAAAPADPGSWGAIANMSKPRDNLGVGVLNNKLYAVGGINGGECSLETAECYNPGEDSWAAIAPMSTQRYGPGVGAVGGLLCVVGGVQVEHRPSGDFPSYLTSAECYNATTDTWAAIAPMKAARSSPGVGVLDGRLYVVGGQHQMVGLDSVERYDPATDTWTLLAPMSTVRSFVGAGVLGGALYAVGGATGDVGFLASAERYTPRKPTAPTTPAAQPPPLLRGSPPEFV